MSRRTELLRNGVLNNGARALIGDEAGKLLLLVEVATKGGGGRVTMALPPHAARHLGEQLIRSAADIEAGRSTDHSGPTPQPLRPDEIAAYAPPIG